MGKIFQNKNSNIFSNFLRYPPPPILRLLDTLTVFLPHYLNPVAPTFHFHDFSIDLKFPGNLMILCHMFVPTGRGLQLRAMWECCVKLCTTSSSF